MNCQHIKRVGKKWNMRHEFIQSIIVSCTNKANFTITITTAKGCKILHVCGIHKNSITKHGQQVGYKVEVTK